MKKRIIYMVIAIAITAILPACNKAALTDLNKNPNAFESIIPDYQFTAALLNTVASGTSSYTVIGQGMHYYSTYKEVTATGDKYYSFGNGGEMRIGAGTWYTSKLNRLLQLMAAVQGANDVNKRALVRILRVYEFHQLTDVLGDIPYTDALKGESAGVLQPKYDTQQSVYMDMLKELNEAAISIDATKPTYGATADLFFAGDLTKWKKFAYTLMLRLAMRLSNVDAATGKTWANTAITGGVMSADADIAKISYTAGAGGQNPYANNLLGGNYISPGGDNLEGGKYASDFINQLKNTNDPRLPVISVVWKPTGSTYTADNTFSLQTGMVSGVLKAKPADYDIYSEPSPLILNFAAPFVILSPAEANFLVAEAVLRGWYSGTTEKAAYEAGIRSAMAQWKLWPTVAPSTGVIALSDIDTYITNNPYKVAGTFAQRLEQISVQKWINLLQDDFEIYANWRRTGYPVLTPTNYPGNVTGGKMFRRYAWPTSEFTTNHDNYLAALTRQGFSDNFDDLLLTRVWWDKP